MQTDLLLKGKFSLKRFCLLSTEHNIIWTYQIIIFVEKNCFSISIKNKCFTSLSADIMILICDRPNCGY